MVQFQSRDELREDAQLKQRFKLLDKNKDGMLDLPEFACLLRQKGHFEDDEVRVLFDGVDHNKTGRIHFDEFIDYIYNQNNRKPLTRKEQVAMDARQASAQMWEEVWQVEIHGASFHPDLIGVFERGELCNGRVTFDREYPQCTIFYGWTENRQKTGWFTARVKPESGPVKRYKMFNPSPDAMGPHLCTATWETPSGQRDKRMLCMAVDREIWDEECTEGVCLSGELWDGEGHEAEEDDDDEEEWEVSPAADDEEQCWEREWWEEVGEDVEDFVNDDVEVDRYTVHGEPGNCEEEPHGPVDLFEDNDFPPGPNALGISLAKATRKMAEVSPGHLVDGWTRVSQVHECPCLFKNIVPEDVLTETTAVNRWFLCACAVVAEHPAWIHSMFGRTTRLTPDGKYSIRLYHPGKKAFVKVVINDYVPTKGGKPAFAGVSVEGEVWPSLIEKAFAKLCCSYKGMEWGSTAYGLLYLCGGGGAESWARSLSGMWKRSYTVWKGKAGDAINRKRAEGMMSDGVEIDSNRLWRVLREYMEYSYPVACAVEKALESACGLRSEWTYTLIGAREVPVQNQILRMVLLRNPFSAGEWTGRWSDTSKAWDECPVAMNHLKFKPKKDGCFWMAFSDFLHYFEGVVVVRKSMPVQGGQQIMLEHMKKALNRRETDW